MDLQNLWDKNLIIDDLRARDKAGVLKEISEKVSAVRGLDAERLFKVLVERERLGTTGIHDGLAIPHGKFADLQDPILLFARSKEGIDFDSLDGKATNLFVLLVTPDNSAGRHLKALARVSRLFRSRGFREKLMAAGDADEIWRLIDGENRRHD